MCGPYLSRREPTAGRIASGPFQWRSTARGRHEESRRPLPRGAGFPSLISLAAAAQAAMASAGSLVSSMVAAAVLEMGM